MTLPQVISVFNLGVLTGIYVERWLVKRFSGQSGSATVSPDVAPPGAQKLENDTEHK